MFETMGIASFNRALRTPYDNSCECWSPSPTPFISLTPPQKSPTCTLHQPMEAIMSRKIKHFEEMPNFRADV